MYVLNETKNESKQKDPSAWAQQHGFLPPKQLIDELLERNLTLRKIAAALYGDSTNVAILSGFKLEKNLNPKWNLYLKLLTLHEHICNPQGNELTAHAKVMTPRQLVLSLKQHGFTDAKIAAKIHCHTSTIYHCRVKNNMMWYLYVNLLILWAETSATDQS